MATIEKAQENGDAGQAPQLMEITLVNIGGAATIEERALRDAEEAGITITDQALW
ncbi:MAG: hypothetical protein LBJ69_02810 [Holosporales bacterium]|jgi:hypothetical protein|nr:hypothetical protein [Holosporales bacterium]